eukprot:TRINITY_DN51027_c0_g1_i1.p1 TRINITY_DN51027_c0_g1~~TRINITY_DN51027_c0_g1_i1.p1  ORF type:complete len:411 (+),score=61.87 TRINITY_DN51027_c0_g1_i1:26-1234(+)
MEASLPLSDVSGRRRTRQLLTVACEWRPSSLVPGSPVMVRVLPPHPGDTDEWRSDPVIDIETADWRPAVVRSRHVDGGSVWLQLAADDPMFPATGPKRVSVPLLCDRIRPIDDQMREFFDTRLHELAAASGLALEAPAEAQPGSAEEELHIQFCMLNGREFMVTAPRSATVLDLKYLAGSATTMPVEEVGLILKSQLLEVPTAQPLLDADASAPTTLQLLRCPRVKVVCFDPEQGLEQFEGVGRLSLCVSQRGPRVERWPELVEAIRGQAGAIIALSVRGWQKARGEEPSAGFMQLLGALRGFGVLQTLDISGSPFPPRGVRLLTGRLPPTLVELDLSECWPLDLAFALNELIPFAKDVALLLRELQHLRILRMRGLDKMAADVDARGIVRQALNPGCAVQF